MKNIVSLFTGILLIISSVAFAKQVDEQTAKQVGQVFLLGTTFTKTLKSADNLELVYQVGTENNSQISDIRLFDIVGKEIATSPNPSKGGELSLSFGEGRGEAILDISHLSAGVYFLKIENKTIKIIKN